MEKLYTCICGKSFTTVKQLSAHQASCRQFYIDRDGNDNVYVEKYKKVSQHRAEKRRIKYEATVKEWESKQRFCENCGKLLTDINGSWRFCSRSCANTRVHSEKTRLKISSSLRGNEKVQELNIRLRNEREDNYYKNPKICCICGNILTYDNKHRQTCSDKCLRKLESLLQKEAVKNDHGNHNNQGINGKCKYGTYHGIECDSSYELTFVIYCLDNGIEVKRNTEYFKYTIDGETHNYFPDFIVGNVYIEIKGYLDKTSLEKYNQFPMDKYIVIIYDNKMNKFLNYCINTYGIEYTKMYDEDKPHWKYT